jgi:hypothetical protein
MDFPDFENDIQIKDEDNNNFDVNITHNTVQNDIPSYEAYNDQSNNYNIGGASQGGFNSMDWSSPSDPEEQKRLEARRAEEEERRSKLNEKIRQELESKQETRKQAMEWIQRWEEQRSNNIQKKREFNKANEEEFLKNRTEAKNGNTNPWDKVIEHIHLKESEHKGIRDISRMKNVILQRKVDFVNMKIK